MGNFCKKICSKELSKIAQSGHTARNVTLPKQDFILFTRDRLKGQNYVSLLICGRYLSERCR